MLVHVVFFWLKKNLSESDKAKFVQGIESIAAVKSLKGFHVGAPAPTAKRPSIDDSYDFGLYTSFENIAGHDEYQKDPIHLQFLENCKHLWESVKVYDFS
ncbi:MAG: Dabb family protein [Cytophagales bacterium]|nr:MAG: Dabb family protein [Cytophagales bacterium]